MHRLCAAISIAILALTLAACGTEGPVATGKTSASQGSDTSTRPPAPAGPRDSPVQRPPDRCQSQLGGLLRTLDTLRRRLAIGLTYDRYLYDVRKLKAAYDEIPTDRLTLACLISTATPAEQAINHYIEAANTWGNCLSTPGCKSISVEPKLQRKWQQASESLSVARREVSDPRNRG